MTGAVVEVLAAATGLLVGLVWRVLDQVFRAFARGK